MEIKENTVTIDKYPNGYVITIRDKNITTRMDFVTPCMISYKYRLFQLNNSYITEFKNENVYEYVGEEFERMLPLLLRYGTLLPKKIKTLKI